MMRLRGLWVAVGRQPLIILLPLQALILFWRLSLLSPWFDEADTLLFTHGSLRGAIEIPASGLHPPLYFFVLWCWMRLPLGLAWTVQARTLSVLFTLASTVAVDRSWARRWNGPNRFWFLTLWCLSPFLLLYGRMSRSYSLQLLLGVAAAAFILRFAKERSTRNFAAVTVLLILAMYTHYVPGVALLAATNVVLARQRRWLDAVKVDGLTALALLPWVAEMIPQLQVWGAHHVAYALTGGIVTEVVLKLAYWAMSFTMGEAIPDAVLVLGALLVPMVLLVVLSGATKDRELTWFAMPAAVVGFLGVTRWVAYPFIPARMIFCFPIFLSLFIGGTRRFPKVGSVAKWGLLAASLSGIWCYFHRDGFRNKQYPLPMAEIAERIRLASDARHSVVLVDSSNSDIIGLRYALGDTFTLLATEDQQAAQTVAQWIGDAQVRTVWFLRNTHDVSPQGLNGTFAGELGLTMQSSRFSFEPFTPLELRFARAMGMSSPPQYFTELIEYRK